MARFFWEPHHRSCICRRTITIVYPCPRCCLPSLRGLVLNEITIIVDFGFSWIGTLHERCPTQHNQAPNHHWHVIQETCWCYFISQKSRRTLTYDTGGFIYKSGNSGKSRQLYVGNYRIQWAILSPRHIGGLYRLKGAKASRLTSEYSQ